MSTTAALIANEVSQLASIPDIAFQISDLLDDDNSSAWDIGRLIEQDPALSTALLRIANSALYNGGIPVTAIDRAVTLVGSREVRDISFGVCTSTAFKDIPIDLISMEDFWRHSLSCAAAAKAIGQALSLRCKDSLFMAGLLHDIGRLVMFSQRPDDSRKALELTKERSDVHSGHIDEQKIFGFDHTDVGDALMSRWGLPDYLKHAARFHHDPDAASESQQAVDIVHIANEIATLAWLEADEGHTLTTDTVDNYPGIKPSTLQRTGLTYGEIPIIAEITRSTVGELLSVFVH